MIDTNEYALLLRAREAAPEMLAELKKAERLLMMCLALLSEQRIADFIPFGLKEDVEAFVYGNESGALIAQVEGR